MVSHHSAAVVVVRTSSVTVHTKCSDGIDDQIGMSARQTPTFSNESLNLYIMCLEFSFPERCSSSIIGS